MTVYDLVKGNLVHAAETEETVLDAVRRMVRAGVGAVPVLRNGQLVGMFSERDLMRKVVAEERDPRATRVSEVMSSEVLVVHPDESLDRCMLLMKEHGIRHLPICSGDRLIGVVSLRDILLHDVEEKDGEVQFMRAYIQGST